VRTENLFIFISSFNLEQQSLQTAQQGNAFLFRFHGVFTADDAQMLSSVNPQKIRASSLSSTATQGIVTVLFVEGGFAGGCKKTPPATSARLDGLAGPGSQGRNPQVKPQ
jgi:hypothetical protein